MYNLFVRLTLLTASSTANFKSNLCFNNHVAGILVLFVIRLCHLSLNFFENRFRLVDLLVYFGQFMVFHHFDGWCSKSYFRLLLKSDRIFLHLTILLILGITLKCLIKPFKLQLQVAEVVVQVVMVAVVVVVEVRHRSNKMFGMCQLSYMYTERKIMFGKWWTWCETK